MVAPLSVALGTKASSLQVRALPQIHFHQRVDQSFLQLSQSQTQSQALSACLVRDRLCAGGKAQRPAPVPRHALCTRGSHYTCSPQVPRWCASISRGAEPSQRLGSASAP